MKRIELEWLTGNAVCRRISLTLLTLTSLLLPIVAQPGFISIDCGGKSNYTDTTTTIQWTTDAGYIQSGTNKDVSFNTIPTDNKMQLGNARLFSTARSKHCYVLPVKNNATYLLRAMFLYGNLDLLTNLYSFAISIDSAISDNITIGSQQSDVVFTNQYVLVATGSEINFCLLPTGSDPPFISSLELRPMKSTMYPAVYGGKYLKTFKTLNCGAYSSTSGPSVRYPDDKYDRIWTSPSRGFDALPGIATSSLVPIPDNSVRYPPEPVLQTAWTTSTKLFWFSQDLSAETQTTSFFVVLHFAEIGSDLLPTDVRGIDITLNGLFWFNLNVTTYASEVWNYQQVLPGLLANFTLTQSAVATLPPILNAHELYAVRLATTTRTSEEDVAALNAVRASMGLSDWSGDPCLPVAWNWLTCDGSEFNPRVIKLNLSTMHLAGTIPPEIADLTKLTDLWLDDNNLTGPIPDLSALQSLQTLHLQNNALSGGIPQTLAKLSALTELFLQNNLLSGPIPADLANMKKLKLVTFGNAGLCDADVKCSVIGPSGSKSKGGGVSGAAIGGAIGGVVVLIIVVLLILYFCWYKRKQRHNNGEAGAPAVEGQLGGAKVQLREVGNSGKSIAVAAGAQNAQQARSFSLAEVNAATENFKTKIGEGGFGPVFYGRLRDGNEVAVKVNSQTSGQGTAEFLNEVTVLSRVHHRNLVALVGYCEEKGQQILIYEFMAMGTLRQHLYGKDLRGRLSWKERLEIAFTAAKGLEYLHNDCTPKIIHRDVKSNNILLTEKLEAKVADFGISKLALDEDTTQGVSTMVRGTTGYLDPEYWLTQKLTQKSDVYSFGVVLLEILCGRAPLLGEPTKVEEWNLVDWARNALVRTDILSILDPWLKSQGGYNDDALWKIADLAMSSVEPHGGNRPDIRQVVRELTDALQLENMLPSNGPSSHENTSSVHTPDKFSETSFPTQTSVSSDPPVPSYGLQSSATQLYTSGGGFVRRPSNEASTWSTPLPR